MTDKSYSLDVVVPCYHEEEALPNTIPQILAYFRDLVTSSNLKLISFKLILVDDGSSDKTWEIINQFASQNNEIVGIKLSRNYGHQSAMLAGLHHTKNDVIITMDADLQDDITAVKDMLLAYEGGSQMALGVRSDRSSDSSAKRGFANAYYSILSLLGVDVINNHADFRLMSRKALHALLQHNEINLFLRGLIPTLGFTTTLIPYVRQTREHGETKYTTSKMLRLAIDGITSFSVAPLRLIAALGGLIFLGAISLLCYFFVERLFFPYAVPSGWASTVIPVLFLGGVQMLSMGILGEYVGKIYMEVKRRPRFIIDMTTGEQ